MPLFDLRWSMEGRATIEADDEVEAETLLGEGLENLDSSMFDSVDIDDINTQSVRKRDD